MNSDYSYCIGACEPLCSDCKRHCPPQEPCKPYMKWWISPMARDNKCIYFDPKRDDYAYRAKKTSTTRKVKFAEGVYNKTPRDKETGRFISKNK